MDSHSARVPLPENWSRSVKTAVLHVIALAHLAILRARSIVVNSPDARTRRAGDLQGALNEIALLEEELRIKDGRMAMIDPHRRPYYRPIERMAIFELKAARGWSQAETARRFLVKPTTIASWLKRIDESGAAPLVQVREPVNKFPDLARYLVRRLKLLFPSMSRSVTDVPRGKWHHPSLVAPSPPAGDSDSTVRLIRHLAWVVCSSRVRAGGHGRWQRRGPGRLRAIRSCIRMSTAADRTCSFFVKSIIDFLDKLSPDRETRQTDIVPNWRCDAGWSK